MSLTAVMEGLARRAVLTEIDRDVAAFWHSALCHAEELCDRVFHFDATRENVEKIAASDPANLLDRGFRTLVLNRTRRSGILAPGASFTRTGENGKGLTSRWYPKTIVRRLRHIDACAERIVFCEGDGMKLLDSMALIEDAVVFVDPPYTAGGKRAGRRLYTHHQLDHARLFETLAESNVDFLMTYDMAPQIVALVREHNFAAVRVAMKNSHHALLRELVITRHAVFAD